jgi:hypothetical protein
MAQVLKNWLVVVVTIGWAVACMPPARRAVSAVPAGPALMLSIANAAGGPAHKAIYKRFSDMQYTFRPGDCVEYDVRLLDNVAGAGGVSVAGAVDVRDDVAR